MVFAVLVLALVVLRSGCWWMDMEAVVVVVVGGLVGSGLVWCGVDPEL